MRWLCYVAYMGGEMIRKSEGKWPLGRPSHKWEGNLRMGLRSRVGSSLLLWDSSSLW